MIRKHITPPGDSPKQDAPHPDADKERLVGELYGLADEVIRIYSDHDIHERHRSKWAAQRLARMTRAYLEGDSGSAAEGPHDWLLDALEDLELYADREGLDRLKGLLVETRLSASDILRESAAPGDGET
jgi:hypothetical protein